MNADLTVSTLAFKQTYSDKDGSLRRETSRGANLPETMAIKHQKYTDSLTKKPGRQSALIFERYEAATDGAIVPIVRVTLKVQVLEDANVASSDITDTVARVIDVISPDGTHLNLDEAIFVNLEQ